MEWNRGTRWLVSPVFLSGFLSRKDLEYCYFSFKGCRPSQKHQVSNNLLVHLYIYTPCVDKSTLRVTYLAQEHNTIIIILDWAQTPTENSGAQYIYYATVTRGSVMKAGLRHNQFGQKRNFSSSVAFDFLPTKCCLVQS